MDIDRAYDTNGVRDERLTELYTTTPQVGEALQEAARALVAVTGRPRLEAELLLVAICRCSRAALLSHPEFVLDQRQAQRYAESIARRAAGTPLPYITGTVEFFGRTFAVTPEVLIARPETELLVERALHHLRRQAVRRIIDVGTGSGCIAVTLAATLTERSVVASDISRLALVVARSNAAQHEVASRVEFVRADLLKPFRRPLDLVVCNPPYVAETEWQQLPISVRQEPKLALLGGKHGLEVISRLLAQARMKLARGGCLLVEIGEKQANAVRALAHTAFPEAEIGILPDLAGKARLLEILLP